MYLSLSLYIYIYIYIPIDIDIDVAYIHTLYSPNACFLQQGQIIQQHLMILDAAKNA